MVERNASEAGTYALAIDLSTKRLKKLVKGAYNACYPLIEERLARFGFRKEQGTLYVGNCTEGQAAAAVAELLRLPWFLPAKKQFLLLKVEASWTLDSLMDSFTNDLGDEPTSEA